MTNAAIPRRDREAGGQDNTSSDGSDVAGRIILKPDPGLVASLGANHTLPSALADLIDNSIDAGTTRVLIRFVTSRDRLKQIVIMDNGRGMTARSINGAMTLGKRRNYSEQELGHFGLGLKTAALSKGEALTVHSRAVDDVAVGRRLRKADVGQDFSCEILTDDSARAGEELRQRLCGGPTGTSVSITELTSTYTGNSTEEAKSYLDEAMQEVRQHLAIVFHRLLEAESVEITTAIVGSPRSPGTQIPVRPISPFGYATSGAPRWPRVLTARLGNKQIHLTCHIWPAKSQSAGFRLETPRGVEAQGLYVYRGDRLLQAGGWMRTVAPNRDKQLARVEIDFKEVSDHIRITPEKSSVTFSPKLAAAIHRATDGSTSFEDYLQEAEDTQTASRKRSYSRKPSVRVGKGFSPAFRKAIQAELTFDEGHDPVAILWRSMKREKFVDVDFQNRTVWINSRYRAMFAGPKSGMNDSPILKTLLYLITRDAFLLEYQSQKARDDIALWNSLLNSALDAELLYRGQ